MSNNISRKGLALGALIAIGASLFAGAPAHAAAGVTLAPGSGTSYNGVVGATFHLTTTASSEIPTSSYPTWAVKVTNLNGSTAHVAIGSNAVSSASADIRATDASATVYDATISNSLSGNNQDVSIASTGSTTASFQVTTWLDANNNHAVDAGELSATQTVTFLGAADLQATTTLTAPAQDTTPGDALTAHVVLSNVNAAYVGNATNVSVDFRVGTYDVRNLSWTSLAGHNATQATVSNDARNVFDVAAADIDASAATTLIHTAGQVVSAQAYLGAAKLGAPATQTVAAAQITGFGTIALVKGDNALASPATFRKNATFQVTLTARGATAAAAAGRTIKVAVAAPTGWVTADGRTVTVNGKTFSNSDDLRANAISVVTDANGFANLTVSTANWGSAGLTFQASADNATSNLLSASVATLNYTATAAVQNGAVVKGGTFQVGVTLEDQFGVAVAGGWNAQAAYNTGDADVATAASNTYAPVVNGAATLNITADGTKTGTARYDIQARKLDTVNGGYMPLNAGVDSATAGQVVLYVRVAQELVSFSQTVVTDSARDLANGALTVANGDNISNWSFVRGVVSSSTDFRPYAAVTVTAPGALLKDNITGTYAVGSINVVTDANGAWKVWIASNTTGQQAVTVTSGALSNTTNVVFNAPANTAGVSILNNTPVVTVLGDTHGVATISVRDVYGNLLTSVYSLDVHSSKGMEWTDANLSGGYLTLDQSYAAGTTVSYAITYSTSARLVSSVVTINWVAETVTVDAPEAATAGQNVDVVVTVLDPNGDPVKNVNVSATSSGVGNLTVSSAKTDVNGQAYLKLFAAAGELGWAYVTATSGLNGVVADVAGVQFQAAPTATDNVATLTLDAPASAQAGTVVDVTATATDADGNAVEGAVVSAVSTGVGYLAVASGTTGADGKAHLKLVVSAGEAGAAVVEATSGDATADAATITAGATDANITISKKRVTVDWSFAANKKVVIVRDGVVIKSFTASSNTADSFSFNLKKGTHKVSVKVGGVTLDSASYKIAK